MLGHYTGRRRPAVTLIELMVVMGIILVLMSLAVVAVMAVFQKGPETAARVEIEQLTIAHAIARKKLNEADYLPSRLVLREDGQYSGPDAQTTFAFLQKMFGKNIHRNGQIDWNNNGKIDSGDLILEGHHCLVFWLGGIPTVDTATGVVTMNGFSADPTNPAKQGGSRIDVSFEFRSDRLKIDPKNGFPYFIDSWGGKPYAYFSATNQAFKGDCPSLGVNPYMETPKTFINPRGFQIISAGKDGAFGAGGGWLPNGNPDGGGWNPGSGYPGPPGVDDQSNFSASLLGRGRT